ncbi:uncharacterized protein isoform X2 [Danio rerio]|uniref:Uncharacterized protein isoform X2 n=2 Tax=Danio rerio TaxID=7955 RepID=A0AC58JLW2_DANRE
MRLKPEDYQQYGEAAKTTNALEALPKQYYPYFRLRTALWKQESQWNSVRSKRHFLYTHTPHCSQPSEKDTPQASVVKKQGQSKLNCRSRQRMFTDITEDAGGEGGVVDRSEVAGVSVKSSSGIPKGETLTSLLSAEVVEEKKIQYSLPLVLPHS